VVLEVLAVVEVSLWVAAARAVEVEMGVLAVMGVMGAEVAMAA
jgi:hypothetical protein